MATRVELDKSTLTICIQTRIDQTKRAHAKAAPKFQVLYDEEIKLLQNAINTATEVK